MIAELLEAPDYCNSLKFAVNIEQEKRRISAKELNNRRFVLKKIYAYRANEINPFENIPDCVEGMSYKLDLLPFKNVPFAEIFKDLEQSEQGGINARFETLLQCPKSDRPNVLARLHELLDGNGGMTVALVLAAAKHKYHYLIAYPTEKQYRSEFSLTGTWRGVTSYLKSHTTSTGEFTESIEHIEI